MSSPQTSSSSETQSISNELITHGIHLAVGSFSSLAYIRASFSFFLGFFKIQAEVHTTAPVRDKTIAQFPAGKVGVYTSFATLTLLRQALEINTKDGTFTNESLFDDGFSCRSPGGTRLLPLPSSLLSVPWTVTNKTRNGDPRVKFSYAEKDAAAERMSSPLPQFLHYLGIRLTLTAEWSVLQDYHYSEEPWHLLALTPVLAFACSSLRASFKDFKEKMEIQLEEQAQELYNRVAELEAYVMDVSGRLMGIYIPPTGSLGRRVGRDFGMQEMFRRPVHEHGVSGRSNSVVNLPILPEVASADYVNAVKALEDAHFPLVDLLKSKKDVGMDEGVT
ncbi:hypothetical protein Tco_0754068 [Tanacetum coccineum]